MFIEPNLNSVKFNFSDVRLVPSDVECEDRVPADQAGGGRRVHFGGKRGVVLHYFRRLQTGTQFRKTKARM